jgi:hypothetical protein
MLTKDQLEILKELKGTEMYLRDELILIDYPYIIKKGNKKMYSDKTWKEVYNSYWNNSNNEGYWLRKEMY